MDSGGQARLRDDLVRIFRAAIAAVDPARLVVAHLHQDASAIVLTGPRDEIARWERKPVLLVGAGKAAARMAAGCQSVFGEQGLNGLVIVADGCGVPLHTVEVLEAGHPLPDLRSLHATDRLCRLVASDAPATDPILCLISGGASSLLVRPRPPVTLADKTATVRALLACGADIAEVNTVRKHLSEVKGGGLLRLAARRTLVTLLLSDVVGDDPSVIGSGPTIPDSTMCGDALAVLRHYDLEKRVPTAVRVLLHAGAEDERFGAALPMPQCSSGKTTHIVIGSNRTALEAAAREAARLGYAPHVANHPVSGEAAPCARHWLTQVLNATQRQTGSRLCYLSGGETTVHVRKSGRGGRNQEFALALAPEMAGLNISVLSAGTDGIDGPTDAAGAFVDGTTLLRARSAGLDWNELLRSNDSYHFFAPLGDLFLSGPTGTNVMDIQIALTGQTPAAAL